MLTSTEIILASMWNIRITELNVLSKTLSYGDTAGRADPNWRVSLNSKAEYVTIFYACIHWCVVQSCDLYDCPATIAFLATSSLHTGYVAFVIG